MKILKKVMLMFGVIALVYLGVAAFTYPTGAAAGVTNPWEAITLLAERVTQLEWRVARMEKILGLDREAQISFYTEEDVRNSPLIPERIPAEIKDKIKRHQELGLEDYYYTAKIPSDLEGTIKAKYIYWMEVRGPYPHDIPPQPISAILSIPVKIANLTDQTILIFYTPVWTIKDETGKVIFQEEMGPNAGHEAKMQILKPYDRTGGTGLSIDLDRERFPERIDINSISVEIELKEVKWKAFSSQENLEKALRYIEENPWTNVKEYKELFPKIWEYIQNLE